MADWAGSNFTESRHTDTYLTIDPSKLDFGGRYVFITRASKGIGRDIALSYASAGAAGIGIGARSDTADLPGLLAEAARMAGHTEPKVVAVSVDVTDKDSVAAAAVAVGDVFPRLDVLVNNAGIASHVLWTGAVAYHTSKLAVLRLAELLNVDYSKSDGLLAYSVHPGISPTDMGNRLPEYLTSKVTDTPKLGADTVVFLTEKRRDWLAGRYIAANWDMDELLSREKIIVEGNKLKVRMIA
ncbi:short chain dehydrogenase reductase [Grosmannia clavigera kw1407]|uniref:Short chain dehydrogenase reductase n=1 Tax=Grosmannia clavigera (strain kw1407 / UAMH 11150) TaxID=655863 RepID=F0X7Q1_GROCL|nr:short chain dehydrogenase reductase [Grosmannia clavigera kw1407]EFX06455.1 short chain dehydrogenase reductase [Grosmannia clavigera kw1407]